jgi:hypothetical protein
MAHGLSSEQMHKIARSMSDKGRNGDSELVHVMPEEVALLERIGAGTTNPYTGLREFNTQDDLNKALKDSGGKWTSEVNDLAKKRDAEKGQTYDSSTDTYTSTSNKSDSSSEESSNSVRQTIANSITPNDGMYYEGGILYKDGGVRVNQNTSYQDTANTSTPFDGKSYVNGQLIDDNTGKSVTTGHDSVFKTVGNVMALVANPVAYIGGKVAMGVATNFLDKDGDGSIFTKDGKSIFSGGNSTSSSQMLTKLMNDNDDDNSSSALSSVTDTSSETSEEGGAGDDAASTSGNVEGDYGYSTTSKFSSRLSGSQLLQYDYADGTGQPTGTYNGNEKPFHISLSSENARAFSMAEQGSNLIDQLIADMPADLMDQLQGNISMFTTSDNKVAVVAGDPSSGFIEATYEADKDGITTAMSDINAMIDYVKSEKDAAIDGGFMGRVQSYNQFKGQATPGLQIEMTSLQNELAQYTPDSPQYKSAQAALLAIQRELARRTRSGAEATAKNSVDGVTSAVASSAQDLIASSA